MDFSAKLSNAYKHMHKKTGFCSSNTVWAVPGMINKHFWVIMWFSIFSRNKQHCCARAGILTVYVKARQGSAVLAVTRVVIEWTGTDLVHCMHEAEASTADNNLALVISDGTASCALMA